MTVPRASLGRSVRSKVTITLSALQFRANLHGTVADQSDSVVGVCTNGHAATRIRRTDKCPDCGNADPDTWQKGQETGDSLVVLDEKDVAAIRAKDATFKEAINLSVVDADTTYLVPAGSSYFLAPVGVAGGANYMLIAELIRKRPKLAFIGEFSFSAAPKLFRLVLDDGVLVLREMARPEAIRERPQVPTGKVDGKALTLGMQLVDTIREPFEPERWVNAHARDVAELVAKTPAVAAGSGPASGGDLLAQLEASIAAATASKTPAAAPRKRTTKKLTVVKPAA